MVAIRNTAMTRAAGTDTTSNAARFVDWSAARVESQSKPDRSRRRATDAGEALGAALAAFAGVTEEAG